MITIDWYLKRSILVLAFGFFFFQVDAQEDVSKKQERESRSWVSRAEAAKAKGDFAKAEADYRKAVSKNQKNAAASYNFGHLYGDYDLGLESMSQLLHTIKTAQDKTLRHKAFHNLGNAYMAQEDYAQAVNAYKDALRNNPRDDETRYNLALAKELLEKEGQSGDDDDKDDDGESQDDSQSQNQDQNEDQQEQEQEDQDEQDSDDNQEDDSQQQEQDGEGDQDDEDDGEEQDGEEKEQDQDQNQQEQPVAGQELSDEQAENLLRAVENLEKDIQKRLNEEKKGEVIDDPNQKDW